MAVRPGYQFIGVGRALIEQAKAMVAALKGDSIRLDAYEGIAGAGGFYNVGLPKWAILSIKRCRTFILNGYRKITLI